MKNPLLAVEIKLKQPPLSWCSALKYGNLCNPWIGSRLAQFPRPSKRELGPDDPELYQPTNLFIRSRIPNTNTDTITYRNTDINTDKNTDTNTDKNTDTITDKNTDTNTDKNTDTNTDKNTDINKRELVPKVWISNIVLRSKLLIILFLFPKQRYHPCLPSLVCLLAWLLFTSLGQEAEIRNRDEGLI